MALALLDEVLTEYVERTFIRHLEATDGTHRCADPEPCAVHCTAGYGINAGVYGHRKKRTKC